MTWIPKQNAVTKQSISYMCIAEQVLQRGQLFSYQLSILSVKKKKKVKHGGLKDFSLISHHMNPNELDSQQQPVMQNQMHTVVDQSWH